MVGLFGCLLIIFINFALIFLVHHELKQKKLIIVDEVVIVQWRKICFRKVALNRIKAIAIKAACYSRPVEERIRSNGHIVGCLQLHDSDHPYTLGMYKTAGARIGERLGSGALISVFFKKEDLLLLMSHTNVPVYVTSEFTNDYGVEIETILPINDPRIHIFDNEWPSDWLYITHPTTVESLHGKEYTVPPNTPDLFPQEKAFQLAKDSLRQKFGLTTEAIDAMELKEYHPSSAFGDFDHVYHFFPYQENPDILYQVLISAATGKISSVMCVEKNTFKMIK